MGKKTITWKFMKLDGIINRAYKVSSEGTIVHARTMEPLKSHSMQKRSPTNGTDYQAVYIKGYGTSIRAHRIVCETYNGPAPLDRELVDHIDERKNNNHPQNLRWVSCSENMQSFADRNIRKQYSPTKISMVKKLINNGWTNDRIAQKVGMSDSNVSSIKRGRIWKHIEPMVITRNTK